MKDSNAQINGPSDRVDVYQNQKEIENNQNSSQCLSKKAKIIIIVIVACILVFLLVFLLCFFLIKRNKKEKLIIDVDEGQDDMTLLVLASLASEDFEILGVTTMSPVEYVDDTTLAHQKIRDYLGFDYPIYRGLNKPLVRDLGKDTFHHKYGYEFSAPFTPTPITSDAIEFITKTLQENDKVSIINAGPSTNIPYVIKNHPDLAKKIDRIVMMGGTLYGNGNIDSCFDKCEYNIWADPEGAQILLNSDIEIVMVSADLTNRDDYNDEIIANVEKVGNKYSAMVLNFWTGSRETWHDLTAHDPHIILYMLDKKLFKTKKTRLDVFVDPNDTTSYGVLKEVPCEGKECNCIYVEGYNTEEDRKRYWEEFVEILALDRMENKIKKKKK